MAGWIDRLFGKGNATGAENSAQTGDLSAEIRRLQMELQENLKTIERLKSDIKMQRSGEGEKLAAVSDSQMENLFARVAAPVSQLMTQKHLIDSGVQLQARDVMTVAGSLVGVLKSEGLEAAGEPGAVEGYDMGLHQPISAQEQIEPGDLVVIKFPRITYKNRIIRKAGVEKNKE